MNAEAESALVAFLAYDRKLVASRRFQAKVAVYVFARKPLFVERRLGNLPHFAFAGITHPAAALVTPPDVVGVREQYVFKDLYCTRNSLDIVVLRKIERVYKRNDIE